MCVLTDRRKEIKITASKAQKHSAIMKKKWQRKERQSKVAQFYLFVNDLEFHLLNKDQKEKKNRNGFSFTFSVLCEVF